MISISTNEIAVGFNHDDFSRKFSDLKTVSELFTFKTVKHLKCENDKISFLLQRVANFELQFSKVRGDNWFQLESNKNNLFKSAFRFEFLNEKQSVIIHVETDTNVFMELFLERRLKKLISGIVENLKAK